MKGVPSEMLLRASSVLMLLGLLIEGFSLSWRQPISFVVFVFVGGGAMGLSLLLYLLWLVVRRPEEPRST